jgi:hypothetical protein
MRRALLACPLLLLACGEKDPSTGGGADSGDEIVIDPPEEDDEEDPGPVDADGDGHDDTVDCDDGDAEVHPDATEAWNGVDDDCDGRRDADGSYRGTLSARATAVYEGDDYAFDLACTAALERDGPDFTLVATCPTDACSAPRSCSRSRRTSTSARPPGPSGRGAAWCAAAMAGTPGSTPTWPGTASTRWPSPRAAAPRASPSQPRAA